MFETEDLISEIEKQPAIWNTVHEDYNNKISKKIAWECVAKKFTSYLDELEVAEKNNIILRFQRKWKSLRDCYTRELLKKKKEKYRSATASRKQYIYFKNLSFLQSLPKPLSNLEDETSQDLQEITVKEETVQEPEEHDVVVVADTSSKKRSNKSKRNKDTTEEDELFVMLREKVMKYNEQEDDDKLFMLSLVPELKRIPESEKLDIKIELMNVFKKARFQHYDQISLNHASTQEISSFDQQSMPHLEPADQSEHSWCSPPISKRTLSPDSENLN